MIFDWQSSLSKTFFLQVKDGEMRRSSFFYILTTIVLGLIRVHFVPLVSGFTRFSFAEFCRIMGFWQY